MSPSGYGGETLDTSSFNSLESNSSSQRSKARRMPGPICAFHAGQSVPQEPFPPLSTSHTRTSCPRCGDIAGLDDSHDSDKLALPWHKLPQRKGSNRPLRSAISKCEARAREQPEEHLARYSTPEDHRVYRHLGKRQEFAGLRHHRRRIAAAHQRDLLHLRAVFSAEVRPA